VGLWVMGVMRLWDRVMGYGIMGIDGICVVGCFAHYPPYSPTLPNPSFFYILPLLLFFTSSLLLLFLSLFLSLLLLLLLFLPSSLPPSLPLLLPQIFQHKQTHSFIIIIHLSLPGRISSRSVSFRFVSFFPFFL